tara:strand:+ start:19495 stop:20463 length:969 start_codon:yes stop_codon:yes gene_type:complete
MFKYLKRRLALLSLSLSRVEKTMLTQKSDALGDVGSMEQTYHQGMLADALLRGEITMPVKELRWRLYKVLSESKNKTAKITGYDDDGLPIVESYTVEKYKLDKIKCDNFDPYPVELVVRNEDIMKSTTEALSDEKLQLYSDEENKSERGDRFNLVGTESWSNRSLGEISFDDMVTSIKPKKMIFVARNTKPKFEIENYAKKLLVRNISETEKLLEFYISSYPDEYNKKTKFLISEIKKAIKNPRASDILDINKVGFITEKTIGAADGLEFEYEVKKIDKIIEFNGHYVIKFISEVTINGDNIFEKYKLEELEKRYENKEAKK